jgi:hypothetical protein
MKRYENKKIFDDNGKRIVAESVTHDERYVDILHNTKNYGVCSSTVKKRDYLDGDKWKTSLSITDDVGMWCD